MIDISAAQLEPFCGFHEFHEDVNVYLKVTLTAAMLLVRHASDPNELHNLIKLAHPSWNTPPVRDMSLVVQRGTYEWISSFALVAIFSAFDDFLVGTEAELHRFYRGASAVPAKVSKRCAVSTSTDEDDDDDAKIEKRLLDLYAKNKWDEASIKPWLRIVRYFRLCRNCIAHRNGRASRALVDCGADQEMHDTVGRLLDRASDGLRKYALNDRVEVEPTQAILCSHLLREIAADANQHLIRTLGLDGFLGSVAHHTMFSDAIVRSEAYKTPKAVLNFALTDRYRARVSDREESVREMKRVDLWKRYIRAFDSKYANT